MRERLERGPVKFECRVRRRTEVKPADCSVDMMQIRESDPRNQRSRFGLAEHAQRMRCWRPSLKMELSRFRTFLSSFVTNEKIPASIQSSAGIGQDSTDCRPLITAHPRPAQRRPLTNFPIRSIAISIRSNEVAKQQRK